MGGGGGTQSFRVFFLRKLKFLAILKGGGARKLSPCLEGVGKKFQTRDFPNLCPPLINFFFFFFFFIKLRFLLPVFSFLQTPSPVNIIFDKLEDHNSKSVKTPRSVYATSFSKMYA